MSINTKVTHAGWGSGLLGVIIFSGTLPATRIAVGELSPLFLASARAVIAALLGAAMLYLLRQSRPGRSDLISLAIVALGVVAGFPLMSSLALQHVTSAHSTVFAGALPMVTAIFGTLRGNERPRLPFWFFAGIGGAMVAGFAVWNSSMAMQEGDLLMTAAILLCGLGYAEGAMLARRLGGWQVICWALLLALPVMLVLAWGSAPSSLTAVSAPAWLGLAYVSVFSMLIGFVFWYRGLALGGIARIGQLQLLQPFMTLVLAGMLLHETVDWTMIVAVGCIVPCIALSKRFA
jgi:drug/metabolite transporter (DMT)-like permease